MNCHNQSTSSLPTTTPSTTSTTTSYPTTSFTFETTQSTTSIIPAPTCYSYIPFSFDISQKLNSTQFANLKTFLVNPFLESLFPTDVQPTWYSSYTTANFGTRSRPANVGQIVNYVNGVAQSTTATISDFSQPLTYLIGKNVTYMGNIDGLPVNTVIFAGDSLTDDELTVVQTEAANFTSNGNTLTVVLMDPNIDQTNYQQVTGLNIVIWSDPATTIATIRAVMNCGPLPSSTTGLTSTSTATSPPGIRALYAS
uniref:Uncharacterized protein n=1 Tax=Panagrolaimus sp. JU765 TaxID=591449 RepID=A0AC34RA20_9BILA